MQRNRIKAAVLEAERFIQKATLFMEKEELARTKWGCGNCPRESGATRRASLDLTRALAEMRRP